VPRPRYRPQRVSLPTEARGEYYAAALSAFIVFAAMGLFAGLADLYLVVSLDHPSHALLGATLFAVFAAAVIAQLATMTWAFAACWQPGWRPCWSASPQSSLTSGCPSPAWLCSSSAAPSPAPAAAPSSREPWGPSPHLPARHPRRGARRNLLGRLRRVVGADRRRCARRGRQPARDTPRLRDRGCGRDRRLGDQGVRRRARSKSRGQRPPRRAESHWALIHGGSNAPAPNGRNAHPI
jgi:hypothetical protein